MTARKQKAIALRAAAIRWVDGSKQPIKDSKDSRFKKLDKALLRAAVHYAKVAEA